MTPNIIEISPLTEVAWLRGYSKDSAIFNITKAANHALWCRKKIYKKKIKVGTKLSLSLPDCFHPTNAEFKITAIMYDKERHIRKIRTKYDEVKVVNLQTNLLVRYPKDPVTGKVIFKDIPETEHEVGNYLLDSSSEYSDSIRKYVHSEAGGHYAYEYFKVDAKDDAVYGVQAIARFHTQ